MNKIGLQEYFKAFRVTTALKLVLAGTICILINNIFHLEYGYFAALFCMLLLVLYHGVVFKTGVYTFGLTAFSGIVSIGISYVLIEAKVSYVVVMSLWIFLVVSLLMRNFLMMLVSGVAATMIMYNSIYNSVAALPELFQDYLIQLALSIIVSAIIDDLVWPHRSRKAFQLILKTVYQEFSDFFKSYTEAGLDTKKPANMSISLITFSNLITYVNRMEREEQDKDFPVELYLKMITFSRGIYLKLEVLQEFSSGEHSFMKDERVTKKVDQMLKLIQKSFLTMADSIGTKKVIDIEEEKLKALGASLHEVYREMHEVEGMRKEYYDDLHAFGGMMPILDEVTENIIKITEAINIFHRNDYQKMLEERVSHTKGTESRTVRSFFSIGSEQYKAGIKTVVIFLVLMFGEAVIGLPGGNQVVFFAIVFGTMPNLGQAYMKSRYGILGVLCGLVYSFISLTIVLSSPHFLLVILLYALGTFVAAYVASSRDIAAAGLQAGLLFPFSILMTTGPDVGIADAFTRFCALLSAVFIGLVVQHLIWPVNPYKALILKISKSIDLSGKIFSKLVTTKVNEREKMESLVLPLASTLPSTAGLLHDTEYVVRSDELHREEFIHIIESIELIYADLETLKRIIFENKDNDMIEAHRQTMKTINDRILESFREVSGQFNAKQNFTEQIKELRIDMDAQITSYRESGQWRQYDPKGIEKLVLINNSLDGILDSLSNISLSVSIINEVGNDQTVPLKTSQTVLEKL